ncbi:formyltransferase family protein [Candidatus Pelagibacter ubique]|nr:formyltransferase family protein [Candidatus Pelagibacter ubique]
MRNNIFFADEMVGVECIMYLIKNNPNDILNIIVTNESSIVYKKLIEINYDNSKIIFNRNFFEKSFNDIDYIFLLWWPHIIGEKIIKMSKFGVINTHPSLLPHNRGKNYNFWNLVEDVPFGVTLHFVDNTIDGGDIIFQNRISKNWEDTGYSLYCKAKKEMVNLFKKKYKKIVEHQYVRVKQNLDEGSFHFSKELNSASQIFLDNTYKASELFNLLRARTFPPNSSCFFIDENKKYEVSIEIKEKKL